VAVDRVDDDAEEAVEQRDDVLRRPSCGELRRADQVDEQHRHLTLLASQSDRPVERVARHLRPHVASEQVVQALALAEAHNHVVEPTLEQADLAAVVYRDGDIEVPLLEPLDRITEGDEGSPTERATSTVASRPTIPAATLSTRTLTATRSSDAPSVRT